MSASSGDITWLDATWVDSPLPCSEGTGVLVVVSVASQVRGAAHGWPASVERILLLFDVSILAAFPRQGG